MGLSLSFTHVRPSVRQRELFLRGLKWTLGPRLFKWIHGPRLFKWSTCFNWIQVGLKGSYFFEVFLNGIQNLTSI